MAKRKKKHATALFDVMTAGRKLEPLVTRRKLFQSPSFFSVFKPKPHDPNAVVPPKPKAAVMMRVVETEEPEQPARPREPFKWPLKWTFKLPENFKLDPQVCVIAASGLVIVIGLFVMIERKFGGDVVPTMVAVSPATPKQAAKPAVLDLSHHTTPVGPAGPAQLPQPTPIQQPAKADGQRVINMNYVLVQIYQDKKMAKDAADMLKRNGVPCSVIKSVPRWANSDRWYGVIGMQPFGPQTSNTAAYRNYVEKIRAVGVQFAGKSQWKQFNPHLYQWRADSAAAESQ